MNRSSNRWRGRALLERLQVSITAGLVFAALLAALASVILLVSGGVQLQRMGISYWQLLAFYGLAGIVGGLVHGAFQTLAKGQFAKWLLWVAALLPAQAFLAWLMTGPDQRGVGVVAALIAASLYAAVVVAK